MDFLNTKLLNFQLDANELLYQLQEKFERNSINVALMLNLVHLSCKLLQLSEDGKELIIGLNGFDFVSGPIMLDEEEKSSSWVFYIEFLLIFLSFANAARVFLFQFTDYPLFSMETEPRFESSETPNDLDKRNRSVRLKLCQLPTNNYKLVWVLRAWSPKSGSLNILSFFSPIQVLLVYRSNSNPALLLLAFFSSLFIHSLVDLYSQSIQDNRLLSHELVTEALKGKAIVFSKIH